MITIPLGIQCETRFFRVLSFASFYGVFNDPQKKAPAEICSEKIYSSDEIVHTNIIGIILLMPFI